jgi:hypothetical protein
MTEGHADRVSSCKRRVRAQIGRECLANGKAQCPIVTVCKKYGVGTAKWPIDRERIPDHNVVAMKSTLAGRRKYREGWQCLMHEINKLHDARFKRCESNPDQLLEPANEAAAVKSNAPKRKSRKSASEPEPAADKATPKDADKQETKNKPSSSKPSAAKAKGEEEPKAKKPRAKKEAKEEDARAPRSRKKAEALSGGGCGCGGDYNRVDPPASLTPPPAHNI